MACGSCPHLTWNDIPTCPPMPTVSWYKHPLLWHCPSPHLRFCCLTAPVALLQFVSAVTILAESSCFFSIFLRLCTLGQTWMKQMSPVPTLRYNLKFLSFFSILYWIVELQHSVHSNPDCGITTPTVPPGVRWHRWTWSFPTDQAGVFTGSQWALQSNNGETRLLQLWDSAKCSHCAVY